jgi:hypothetical protein
MPFDVIIPPEVLADDLHRFLYQAARHLRRGTVLEVGSSDGRGSTAALVAGLQDALNLPEQEPNVRLACLELDRVRHAALVARYADRPWVHCYLGESVNLDQLMTAAQVRDFYQSTPTNLNNYPLAQVLSWRQEEIDYVNLHALDEEQIAAATAELEVDRWALVFLDGSPFAGEADLAACLPADLVVLDDINDIKNKTNYDTLLADTANWQLVAESDTRNGWAAFRYVGAY